MVEGGMHAGTHAYMQAHLLAPAGGRATHAILPLMAAMQVLVVQAAVVHGNCMQPG